MTSKTKKIKEIKEVEVSEANKLLKDGWGLLKPPVKLKIPIDDYLEREAIIYVMGK